MNKRYPRGAILFSILAMALVILVSNKLVQYPVQGFLFGIDMSLVLTWGAFTYPVAFFVTDTTNRLFGAGPARRVVAVGFAFGVGLTVIAALAIAAVPGERHDHCRDKKEMMTLHFTPGFCRGSN